MKLTRLAWRAAVVVCTMLLFYGLAALLAAFALGSWSHLLGAALWVLASAWLLAVTIQDARAWWSRARP